MLLDIGGAEPRVGLPSGIHWHMNLANRITYIATDAERQVIPWVQAEDMQGKVTVYTAKGSALSVRAAESGRKTSDGLYRLATTVPATSLRPPTARSMRRCGPDEPIDPSLPFIKQEAVAVLSNPYTTVAEAQSQIASEIRQFYKSKYPQVDRTQSPSIETAVSEVRKIYQSTIFASMKTDWRSHPDNVGHLYSPGCFRCHDGQHTSAEGKVIPKDCDTCHTIQAQLEGRGADGPSSKTSRPVPSHPCRYRRSHPGKLQSDCHSGGVGP